VVPGGLVGQSLQVTERVSVQDQHAAGDEIGQVLCKARPKVAAGEIAQQLPSGGFALRLLHLPTKGANARANAPDLGVLRGAARMDHLHQLYQRIDIPLPRAVSQNRGSAHGPRRTGDDHQARSQVATIHGGDVAWVERRQGLRVVPVHQVAAVARQADHRL